MWTYIQTDRHTDSKTDTLTSWQITVQPSRWFCFTQRLCVSLFVCLLAIAQKIYRTDLIKTLSQMHLRDKKVPVKLWKSYTSRVRTLDMDSKSGQDLPWQRYTVLPKCSFYLIEMIPATFQFYAVGLKYKVKPSTCIAPCMVYKPLQSAQAWITQFTCNKHHTCLLRRNYRPRKDERLSWLIFSGRFTHIVVTRQLKVERII